MVLTQEERTGRAGICDFLKINTQHTYNMVSYPTNPETQDSSSVSNLRPTGIFVGNICGSAGGQIYFSSDGK